MFGYTCLRRLDVCDDSYTGVACEHTTNDIHNKFLSVPLRVRVAALDITDNDPLVTVHT